MRKFNKLKLYIFSVSIVNLCIDIVPHAALITQNCVKFNDQNEAFQLVWNDEFDGTLVNEDKWDVQNDNEDCLEDLVKNRKNTTCEFAENAKIIDNHLALTLQKEPIAQQLRFSGAKLTSKKRFNNGRVEVRLAQPRQQPIRSFVYTTDSAEDRWHHSGQIVLSDTTVKNEFYRNVYFANSADINDRVNQMPDYAKPDQFHLYGFEWDREKVRFFFDDQYGMPIALNETKFIKAQQLRFWIRVNGNKRVPKNLTCPALLIDYVRIYEKVSGINTLSKSVVKCPVEATKPSESLLKSICKKIDRFEPEENEDDVPVASPLLKASTNNTILFLVGIAIFVLLCVTVIGYVNYRIRKLKHRQESKFDSFQLEAYDQIDYDDIGDYIDVEKKDVSNTKMDSISSKKACSYLTLLEDNMNEYVPIKKSATCPKLLDVDPNVPVLFVPIARCATSLRGSVQTISCAHSQVKLQIADRKAASKSSFLTIPD